MTERACLPEPPWDCSIGDLVARLRLGLGGEEFVELGVKLARRIIGDVEQADVRSGGRPRAQQGEQADGRADQASRIPIFHYVLKSVQRGMEIFYATKNILSIKIINYKNAQCSTGP